MTGVKNKRLQVVHLGLIKYQKALHIQEIYHKAILAIKQKNLTHTGCAMVTPNYLLFCQHFLIYTLGSSTCQEHFLVDFKMLQQQGIELCKVNRGGAITYHGPGQLVVYLIVDLENFFKDIHRFIRLLEEAVMGMLNYFNIFATQISGLTGVWLKADSRQQLFERKICSIGIKVSRWVTMHGLALNINNDLEPFKKILPCGLHKPVTSMQKELNRPVSIEQAINVLKTILFDKLGCDNYDEAKVL